MKQHAQVTVPLVILGVVVIAQSGFYTSIRHFIQKRVGSG